MTVDWLILVLWALVLGAVLCVQWVALRWYRRAGVRDSQRESL